MAHYQGPRAHMVRHLFGFHLYLAGRCCENLQSTRSPMHRKPGPRNNMLINTSHHLYCTIFQ